MSACLQSSATRHLNARRALCARPAVEITRFWLPMQEAILRAKAAAKALAPKPGERGTLPVASALRPTRDALREAMAAIDDLLRTLDQIESEALRMAALEADERIRSERA